MYQNVLHDGTTVDIITEGQAIRGRQATILQYSSRAYRQQEEKVCNSQKACTHIGAVTLGIQTLLPKHV